MSFLVVVKRDEPALFDYLLQHFQEPEISVLLDRRHGERRRQSQPVTVERRHGVDRRAGSADTDPLWRYGFRVATARSR